MKNLIVMLSGNQCACIESSKYATADFDSLDLLSYKPLMVFGVDISKYEFPKQCT